MKFVWGADREIITFDDAGGSYYGPITKNSDGTLAIETLFDTKLASADSIDGWNGGSMMILNGTGEGQYARIIKAGIHDKSIPTNRTWIIGLV